MQSIAAEAFITVFGTEVSVGGTEGCARLKSGCRTASAWAAENTQAGRVGVTTLIAKVADRLGVGRCGGRNSDRPKNTEAHT